MHFFCALHFISLQQISVKMTDSILIIENFSALAVLKDRIQLIHQRSKRIPVELRLKISDQYQHNQRRIPRQVN